MKKVAKKTRIGRPPLTNRAGVRDKRLDFVRFSAEELAAIKQAAADSGVPLSQWVRSRLGV